MSLKNMLNKEYCLPHIFQKIMFWAVINHWKPNVYVLVWCERKSLSVGRVAMTRTLIRWSDNNYVFNLLWDYSKSCSNKLPDFKIIRLVCRFKQFSLTFHWNLQLSIISIHKNPVFINICYFKKFIVINLFII